MAGGRYTDDEEVFLNFKNVALAFEIPFFLIEDHKTLNGDILDIISKRGPALIEVVCDNNQK